MGTDMKKCVDLTSLPAGMTDRLELALLLLYSKTKESSLHDVHLNLSLLPLCSNFAQKQIHMFAQNLQVTQICCKFSAPNLLQIAQNAKLSKSIFSSSAKLDLISLDPKIGSDRDLIIRDTDCRSRGNRKAYLV